MIFEYYLGNRRSNGIRSAISSFFPDISVRKQVLAGARSGVNESKPAVTYHSQELTEEAAADVPGELAPHHALQVAFGFDLNVEHIDLAPLVAALAALPRLSFPRPSRYLSRATDSLLPRLA